MSDRIPAELFPPGDLLREELEERGWTQGDLAEILGVSQRLVSEIATGKRTITRETARRLGAAFGTSAQFWLNLESAYQLARAVRPTDDVKRRARLYTKAPIKDMIRRGWIEPSNRVVVLEKQVVEFFELSSIEDEPRLAAASRKSSSYRRMTEAQAAWLFRAKHLAQTVPAATFTKRALDECLQRLKALTANAQDIRNVPRVLGESGIRFLVVEHLPKTRIDGACLWLDAKSPVVVLSLRYDRINWFWHTLMHELGHVSKRHGYDSPPVLDSSLVGDDAVSFEDKPAHEREIDKFAAEHLVPQEELDGFIARVRPLYSKHRIEGFANRIGVHPGIVLGQLQYRGEVTYSHSRGLLVKMRHIVTATALTDGWGHTPPATLRH